MPLRKYKPTSPGRRDGTVVDFSGLTKKKPHKPLTEPMKKQGGRNNSGRITARHHGGENRRRYRRIDFKRNKDGVPAIVESIEYDPNRTAHIALLLYKDGERRYMLHVDGVQVGETIESGEKVEPKPGNCMPLKNIPTSMAIHNIEMTPGRGGQMVRSAGSQAQLLGKEGEYCVVALPSGERRKIHARCRATIGQLSNTESGNLTYGKAGRRRWMGVRPTVRGTAMNPVAHPMGGGEGRSGGGRHPVSKWGKLAKGGKTRKDRKTSSKFIIRGRKKGKHQKV